MAAGARAHVIVRGMVQGVFFRSSAREKAFQLGVKGWIKNRTDGKVEGIFEGEKYAVMELVDFCRHGPPGASVDDVDVEWSDFEGEFSSFEIRY
jgi:acylphosphatase